MRRAASLPVEHERSTALTQPFFLRATAKHPVRRLHAAPRVGSQKRDHHRLYRWHHTGEVSSSVVWGTQTDSQAACFRTFSLEFLYSFKSSSHYFGISQVAAWMSINEIITTRLLCVIANSAASLQSKLWTVNWALLGSGHPTCMYTSHTPTNDIIAVLLPRVMGCACTSLHMRVHWLLCWITSDFATRYVSLTQIWKTEYTRTQLPGPPEEPVSPGQDQTERDGNGTSGKMGIFT